jgi:hypothetical protein
LKGTGFVGSSVTLGNSNIAPVQDGNIGIGMMGLFSPLIKPKEEDTTMSRRVFCSVSVPVLVATLILSPTAARAQQTPGQIAMFGSDTSLVDSVITENPISGNIGVGTTNPLGQLHVKGDDPVRILGDLSTLSGSESVDFMARNSQYGSDIGGMRIQRDPLSGDVNTLFLAAPYGNFPFERMRVGGNGNVGIGTTTPTTRLQVSGGDEAITSQGSGLILRATDGDNCFKLTVNNVGVLSTAPIACP